MKTALVLGCAGFIGQNLCKGLLKRGYKVIGIDNLSFGKKENIPNGVIFYNQDIMHMNINEKVDYVFYFAGPCSVIQYNKDPLNSLHATIMGMNAAIDVARGNNAKLIYPSSGNIYGNTLPFDEDCETYPNNLYGLGKKICETMARLAWDVSSVGFRIFAGYGMGEAHKGDISSAVTLFLRDMLNDKQPVIWGDGSQRRDFIYIDDIVDALIEGAEKELKYPIYNLGTGKAYSFNKLIEIINMHLDTILKPIYVEKPSTYVEKTVADTSRFFAEFKTIPRSLEGGMKAYINFINTKDKII